MKRILLGLVLSLCLVTQGYCADQWTKSQLAGTTLGADIDYYNLINNEATDRLLYTYRQGCQLVYASASTITVNSGALALPNSAGTIVRWRRNTSNTTVTWSNIDTGSEANSTTYYLYGRADTDATTFTVSISTNSSAPTGATYYRRLGSFYNDASGNITQITDDNQSTDITYIKGQGNYYKIDSGIASVGANTASAISFTFTYTSAPYVVVTYTGDSGWDEHGTISVTPATSNFTLYNNRSYTRTFNWIAIGQVLAQ